MADSYPKRSVSFDSDPAMGAVAISYGGGDQTFAKPIRAFYIGTAGHLVVTMADGSTATFSNLVAGAVYPFAIVGITASGSTAAGVALY